MSMECKRCFMLHELCGGCSGRSAVSMEEGVASSSTGFIYLASPYAHPDKAVMQERFEQVCRIAGRLMKQGLVVYSPISSNHSIQLAFDLPHTWEFWEKQDSVFVLLADKVVVAKMEGWDKSVGIAAEIKLAEEHGIPVEYVEA